MQRDQRCDSAIVILIVTEYDEHGRPCGEVASPQHKIWRAVNKDFWAEADKAARKLVEAQREQERARQALEAEAAAAASAGKKKAR